jgi:hypothetical protein
MNAGNGAAVGASVDWLMAPYAAACEVNCASKQLSNTVKTCFIKFMLIKILQY